MAANNCKKLDTRPLSPHITIYKPQISSILSISHRITGVVLFVGIILLSWWIFANVYGCHCINALIFSPIGKVILALWSYCLYYHLCNGIRHLFWDAGKGYSLKIFRITGYLVVISSLFLTVMTWLAALGYFTVIGV